MASNERKEPKWLDKAVALAIHDRQLAEHGGGSGVRDDGMLESALARPVNRWAYVDEDLASLAAAYAFGLARNHPFVDGNKRTAWVLARLFLAINGHELAFEAPDVVAAMLALAAGELNEEKMADWFRRRLAALP
jgi:death-on-curing protein